MQEHIYNPCNMLKRHFRPAHSVPWGRACVYASLPFRSTAFSLFVTAARYQGWVPRLDYDGGLAPFSVIELVCRYLGWPPPVAELSQARYKTRDGGIRDVYGWPSRGHSIKYTVHHWPPFCFPCVCNVSQTLSLSVSLSSLSTGGPTHLPRLSQRRHSVLSGSTWPQINSPVEADPHLQHRYSQA